MNKLRFLLGLCTLFVLCAVLPLGSHLTPTIAADPFWGFSLDNLDRTCNPCDNFYQFAMGGLDQKQSYTSGVSIMGHICPTS